jgi:hypothetical protein
MEILCANIMYEKHNVTNAIINRNHNVIKKKNENLFPYVNIINKKLNAKNAKMLLDVNTVVQNTNVKIAS